MTASAALRNGHGGEKPWGGAIREKEVVEIRDDGGGSRGGERDSERERER